MCAMPLGQVRRAAVVGEPGVACSGVLVGVLGLGRQGG
jgi:hypothetical protein